MNKARVFFKISDTVNKFRRNYRLYSNVKVIRNVPYSDINKKYNSADLLFDENKRKGKFPVFVNIHGGGFVGGDKNLRIGISRLFANEGWFVYNINYRLAHKFPAPNATIDVINALNLLPSLEQKYNLDLNKIVVSGDSAGGYLAAHAMSSIADSTVREKLNIPQCKVKIRALALFCGLYDLEKVLGKKTPFDIVNDLASCILGFDVKNEENLKNCDHLKELSPINFVNENWAETYISMAGKDLFCGGQGEEMVKELARNGVKTTIYKAYNMGETHCSHLLPYKKSSLAWYKSAIDFLDKIKV